MDNVLGLKRAHSGSDSHDLPSPKGKATREPVQEGAVVLDSSSEELELWESDRQAAIEKVKTASAFVKSAPWSLARSLVNLKAHYEKREEQEPPTNEQLSDLLQLGVSATRIGQYINTANAYPGEVDETIEFKVYEDVRLFTAQKKMTPEKRLEMVKKCRTTEAVKKLKAMRDPSIGHFLNISAKSARAGAKNANGPVIEVRLDGKKQAMPSNVESMMQQLWLEMVK